MIYALSSPWHKECFKCSFPGCTLRLTSSEFHESNGSPLCGEHYAAGAIILCEVCETNIPDSELVRTDDGYYHPGCFTCVACKTPLADEEYHVHGAHLYCVQDYAKYCCCLLCWDPLPEPDTETPPLPHDARVHPGCLAPDPDDVTTTLQAHIHLFRSLMTELMDVVQNRDIGALTDAGVYVVQIANGIRQLSLLALPEGCEHSIRGYDGIKDSSLALLRLIKPFVASFDSADEASIGAAWNALVSRSIAVTKAVREHVVALEPCGGGGEVEDVPPVPPPRPKRPRLGGGPAKTVVGVIKEEEGEESERRMSSELDELVEAIQMDLGTTPACEGGGVGVGEGGEGGEEGGGEGGDEDAEKAVVVSEELEEVLSSLFSYDPASDFASVSRASISLFSSAAAAPSGASSSSAPSAPSGAGVGAAGAGAGAGAAGAGAGAGDVLLPPVPSRPRRRPRLDPLRNSETLLQAELEREMRDLNLFGMDVNVPSVDDLLEAAAPSGGGGGGGGGGGLPTVPMVPPMVPMVAPMGAPGLPPPSTSAPSTSAPPPLPTRRRRRVGGSKLRHRGKSQRAIRVPRDVASVATSSLPPSVTRSPEVGRDALVLPLLPHDGELEAEGRVRSILSRLTSSETAYVTQLQGLVDGYLEPLVDADIEYGGEALVKVKGMVEELLGLHGGFQGELEELERDERSIATVSDRAVTYLMGMLPAMQQIYVTYAETVPGVSMALSSGCEASLKVSDLVAGGFGHDPVKGIPVSRLLRLPIDRLGTLLQVVCSMAQVGSEILLCGRVLRRLEGGLKALLERAVAVEERLAAAEHLANVAAKIEGVEALGLDAIPAIKPLMHGRVFTKSGQARWMHAFNKLLFWAKKKRLRRSYSHTLQVVLSSAQYEVREGGSSVEFVVVEEGGKEWVFGCSTVGEGRGWVTALGRRR